MQSLDADSAVDARTSNGEVPADLAASLSAFDLENPSLADAARMPKHRRSSRRTTSSDPLRRLPAFVDAALAGAFDDAEEHAEETDVANVYVPDDEIPAVAFDVDETEDLAELESVAELESIEVPAEEPVVASTPDESVSFDEEPLSIETLPIEAPPIETPPIETFKKSEPPMRTEPAHAAVASPASRRRRSPKTRSPTARWNCRTWTTTCSRSSCRKAPTSSIIPIR